jgi:hypothetical protein
MFVFCFAKLGRGTGNDAFFEANQKEAASVVDTKETGNPSVKNEGGHDDHLRVRFYGNTAVNIGVNRNKSDFANSVMVRIR